MAKYLKPPYNPYTPNRKNPPYPLGHCFTTVKCEKCGEHYEPICICEHICKKQNSYPVKEVSEQPLNFCRKCGGKAADWWNRGIYDITDGGQQDDV